MHLEMQLYLERMLVETLSKTKTFLLIRALETANPDQLKTLNALLASDPVDKVEQVLAIFKACKVDAWAADLKQQYMQEALAHLEAIAVVEARKSH